MFIKVIKALVASFLCISCGAYFNQPVTISKAVLGEGTQNTKVLKNLPEPENKIVADQIIFLHFE